MRLLLVALLGSLVLPASFAAFAAGQDRPSGVSYPLFNGQNLDGLVVTGCNTEIRDGVLTATAGDGFIRSAHSYRDFVLEIDWRALRADGYDSGIYFRCQPPAAGKAWPDRYQINLKQGDEGTGIRLPGAKKAGLVKAGEWNRFKLTCIGHVAELEINGQPAWKSDAIEPLEGYIGLQIETPLGGPFAFRNLKVTELGYRSLFNGSDLTGWEGGGADAAKCWKVEDGLLVCTGAKGPWLRSTAQHGDFNLRLEYKLRPGGNSGVYVRVPESGNHHGAGAGVEIQLLDDAHERYTKLKPYQYTGSVYAIAPAQVGSCKGAGEWNTFEINCRGQRYRVEQNGVTIVDVDEVAFPQLKERLVQGFLGLQNHSEEVWFRNLRLGPARE